MAGAVNDIRAGLSLWRQWSYMAANEIKMNYRRSILGPLWLTLNTMVMVGALGAVYSLLFHMDAKGYVPYFALGLLAWQLIAAFVSDGAQTFIQHAGMIKNVNMPLSFFAMKVAAKTMIVFLHQSLVLIPIFLILHISLTPDALFVIPALLLYAVDGLAVCLLTGMLCARYRDMGNILTNFLQVCFFITPIFWPAKNLHNSLLLKLNIFYHFLEIFRAPLLGEAPGMMHWAVSMATSAALMIAAFMVFRAFRTRIVHTL